MAMLRAKKHLTSRSERKYLFIGGMHRSGTTALWEAFRRHGQVSGFPPGTNDCENEGQYSQSVYPSDHHYACPHWLDWPLHPQMHLTEESPLASDANGAVLTAEWARYWDQSKPWLLEKTPRNLVIARFLQRMFPTAHFLFILRHPVAQALALRRIGWSSATVPELVLRWLAAHECGAGDLAHLRCWCALRYEAFITRPEAHFQKVCETFGLAREPLRYPIDSTANEKYRRAWCPREDEVEQLRPLNGRVRAFGYDLFDWEWRPEAVPAIPVMTV